MDAPPNVIIIVAQAQTNVTLKRSQNNASRDSPIRSCLPILRLFSKKFFKLESTTDSRTPKCDRALFNQHHQPQTLNGPGRGRLITIEPSCSARLISPDDMDDTGYNKCTFYIQNTDQVALATTQVSSDADYQSHLVHVILHNNTINKGEKKTHYSTGSSSSNTLKLKGSKGTPSPMKCLLIASTQ